MDVYVNGEPAGTWETATGNTVSTYHEVDVTGIEDLDALEQYFNETGIMPYEMVNGQKVYITFAKLPQNNTAVSASAINDIISIAGGSVVAGYNTEGMIAKLSKSLVLNAIMRTMFLVIDGNSVEQSIISQLESALNPFCIAGTSDMPVYVDSDGTAHVFASAVEAVRNMLIGLGAYSTGVAAATGFTPVSGYTYTLQRTWNFPVYFNHYTEINITGSTWSGHPARILYEFEGFDALAFMCNPDGSAKGFAAIGVSKDTNVSIYQTVYDAQTGSVVRARQKLSSAQTNATVAGNKRYLSYASYSTSATITFDVPVDNIYSNATSSQRTQTPDWLWMYYGNQDYSESAAIPGMTASSSIPVGFGDLSLPLPDVWPDWYAKKKQVATPADDDLYLRSPALPLDVPVDNVFDDGYAGDSEDATDGDLEDILKDAIINVLPDILEDIINNTDITPEDAYEIPVDDTGDTPPAQPPILNGSSNGLWTMYNPTKAQVNSFGAWLWGDTLIDQIMRQFNSPIDAIIGFHQIYCTPVTGADKVIKAGYLDSPVSAKEITDQYATIDCGSVFVDEFYRTALDYNHSHVSIYLPFVGIIPLETSVVTGATLQVIYRIDVFTGTCLAQIKVIKQNSNAVMYAFEGNCAVQIPLTASTYCGVVSSIMNLTQSGISLFLGNMGGAVKGALATVGSGISNLTGTKQSGSMGSNAGALGIRKPYLIVTRPIAYDAIEYSRQYGYPINKTVTLGSLSGYTKVKDIHLSGVPCTDDELELIERLLKEGVIIN